MNAPVSPDSLSQDLSPAPAIIVEGPDGCQSLTYSEAGDLTITRQRAGRGWCYRDAAGTRITDRDEIDRLNAIGLPPAYQNALFNPDPAGHLQAVGVDARGRRQYRYHPGFRAAQEASKFSACHDFGHALTALRREVERDLKAPPTSRAAVLAAMIKLLDTAYIRVGNIHYWRENKTVGLTTLRNRHVTIRGQTLTIEFRAKHGIQQSKRLTDRTLTRIVARCQDLPGQHLFQFRDDDGTVQQVTSDTINEFLRAAMGSNFTAKHFRTWHASVIAFEALREGASMKEAIAAVADALGNTPAVARKSYIHPRVMAADPAELRALRLPRATRYLTRSERGFLEWIGKGDAP